MKMHLKVSLKIMALSLALLISLLTTFILAFLVDYGNVDQDFIVGDIAAEIEAFYEKDGEILPIEISELSVGVINLNISDPTQLEHFNNFRVNIKVHSSVETYFRVAVYEQFTLTYTTGDTTTIVAVTKDDYSVFNYNIIDFFDNREKDGFFYYKHKAKCVDENNPLTIQFIGVLPEEDYHPIFESKYTLQIGFIIDAVQYIDGPKINWGLDSPPWPDNQGW